MHLDFNTGTLSPHDQTNIRKLSDMKGVFLDTESELRILKKEDPMIYSFSERILPEKKAISSSPPPRSILARLENNIL